MFPPTEMDVEVVYDVDGYNKVSSNLLSQQLSGRGSTTETAAAAAGDVGTIPRRQQQCSNK